MLFVSRRAADRRKALTSDCPRRDPQYGFVRRRAGRLLLGPPQRPPRFGPGRRAILRVGGHQNLSTGGHEPLPAGGHAIAERSLAAIDASLPTSPLTALPGRPRGRRVARSRTPRSDIASSSSECCGDDDVFVHVSNLEAGGATLAEGQTVEFEVGARRKREEAKNVRPV